jgi:hypothetical protein
MLIAYAPDKTTARAEVGASLKHLMEGLLIKRPGLRVRRQASNRH